MGDRVITTKLDWEGGVIGVGGTICEGVDPK